MTPLGDLACQTRLHMDLVGEVRRPTAAAVLQDQVHTMVAEDEIGKEELAGNSGIVAGWT